MQNTRLKIGVIMATMLEATAFVKTFKLQQSESHHFPVFENDKLYLVISGVGKANAAAACTYLILTKQPHCICNLGSAGALDETHPLNTISHIKKVVEPDRPVFDTGAPFKHLPDQLDNFPTAVLATQDKAVISSLMRSKVAMVAELADMEGAAVVQSCKYFDRRCYLFKFVSDTPANHQIVTNIRKYRQDFCVFFYETVLPILISQSKGHV